MGPVCCELCINTDLIFNSNTVKASQVIKCSQKRVAHARARAQQDWWCLPSSDAHAHAHNPAIVSSPPLRAPT